MDQLTGPVVQAVEVHDAGRFATERRQGELEAQARQRVDEIGPGCRIDEQIDVAAARFPALPFAVALPLAVAHTAARYGYAESPDQRPRRGRSRGGGGRPRPEGPRQGSAP